jgi:hypothetical protein
LWVILDYVGTSLYTLTNTRGSGCGTLPSFFHPPSNPSPWYPRQQPIPIPTPPPWHPRQHSPCRSSPIQLHYSPIVYRNLILFPLQGTCPRINHYSPIVFRNLILLPLQGTCPRINPPPGATPLTSPNKALAAT